MISISSIADRLSQLSQVGSTNTTTAAGKSGTANMPPPPEGGPPPGGPMLDAITRSLSQLGFGDNASASTTGTVNAVDSSSATDASSNATQALTAFMQSLMAALHAQSSQASGSDNNADSGIQGAGRRPDFGADLQSLMTQLASASSGSSTSGSAADTSLTTLQDSFQTLVSALGGAESNVTLSSFLQTFAGNMPEASSSGNVFSAKV